MDPEQGQLIERFVAVTHSSEDLAKQYLARNEHDLVNAIEDYFASSGASGSPSMDASESTNKPKKPKSGVRTFRDLNDDDEEDDKTQTNFFTGGEKSGLQVEDPNKDKKKSGRSLIDDIFQRAKDQMGEPDDRPSAQYDEEDVMPKFTGTGFKLGDGETPSQVVSDPTARMPRRPQKVNREIVFWKQGFTVADGPLHRYDDPSNAALLQELNQGRVPLALLNVEFGQDVDVSVVRKTDEDYKPPKKKVGGFTGSGHRLGSPVPGEAIGEPEPQASAATETVSTNKDPEPEASGDTAVQIRFANGKRISHKFNSTDSISVVYEFVKTHEFSDPSRSFILSHAFPVKPIENSSDITVADAKLKNAVIVQRWS